MINIAIVEDHAEVREALCKSFSAVPQFRVITACKDLASIKAFIEHTCPDVLLVDLCLPDGNACEVIGRARYRWGARCVSAVLHAHRSDEHLMTAIRNGAKGSIDKSLAPQQWCDTVSRLAAGQSPLSAELAKIFLLGIQGHVPTDKTALSKQLIGVLTYIRNGTRIEELQPPLGLNTEAAGRLARVAYDIFEIHHNLSERELECLRLLSLDISPDERAARMGVPRSTVNTFAARVREKLHVDTQKEAVNEARRQGILP